MYKYVVSDNHKITSTTLLLTLKKDHLTKPFYFQPGQYASISFKNKGRPSPVRCFSMVNSPHDQNKLQFSIRILGNYTKAVANLKVGDTVNVMGPFGGFLIDQDKDQDIVMIAGGIGIAPLISIIHYVSNIKLPNKINLIYSCKNQDDVPFIEQLMDLSDSNPNFKLNFLISDGPTNKLKSYSVNSGRVTSEIIKKIIGSSLIGKKFLICGPPHFMKSMTNSVVSMGANKRNIITEAFNGGPNGQPGNLRSWPFNIYVFGAVGVVLASFAVSLSDLLIDLPSSSLLNTTNLVDSSSSTNSRQNELDKLVNNLPNVTTTLPASPDAINAGQASNTSSTPTTTPTTTTPTTTNPVVTPTVTPKCTIQSGVKTCI